MIREDDWRAVLIEPETPIMKAIEVLDLGALRIALVVDHHRHLLGVVTDGDIRRGLLNRISLKEPIRTIMNTHPITARESESRDHLLSLMGTREIQHLPVIDPKGRLVGLETLNELARPVTRDNWVVLMAGGLGTRLRPLTQACPKPLLKVGSKPILEVILESFLDQGFNRFFFSVNYKKEMIRDHFGDGSQWGAEIRYLEENGRLGTAGPLSLLPETPEKPVFVMNGDLLTRINFNHILDFHKKHRAVATLCVRKVEQTVPYGVVSLDQHRFLGIEEKPVQEYFVNAGIYLLEPELLSLIPKNSYFDMPELFQTAVKNGHSTAAFPFLDYWLDIGRMGDFQQACQDYPEVFQ